MSLVGPRPPLPDEVSAYGDSVRRRLLVKPGLTGLWQVSGRSDLSWEESVRLDLRYVENWSLSLDMLVLVEDCSRCGESGRSVLVCGWPWSVRAGCRHATEGSRPASRRSGDAWPRGATT